MCKCKCLTILRWQVPADEQAELAAGEHLKGIERALMDCVSSELVRPAWIRHASPAQ